MAVAYLRRNTPGIVAWLMCLLAIPRAEPAPQAATDGFDSLIAQASPLLKGQSYEDAAALVERSMSDLDLRGDRTKWLVVSSFLRAACKSLWQCDRYAAAVEAVLARIAEAGAGAELLPLQRQLVHDLARFDFDRFHDTTALRRYMELRDMGGMTDDLLMCEHLFRIYADTGRPSDAFDTQRGALRESLRSGMLAGNGALRRRVAEACLQVGDIRHAVEVLDAAKSIEGKRVAATLMKEAGLLHEAEVVARSLDLGECADALLLADVLFEQRRFAESARLLRDCYGQEPSGSEICVSVAAQLADVHVAEGSLPEAITRTRKEVDAVPAEHLEPRRKGLLLLSRLHMADDDFVAAFRAYLDYLAAGGEVKGFDAHAQTVCFAAVRTLVDQGKPREAQAMLDEMRELEVKELFVDCARHMLLLATGRDKEAEELLLRVEQSVEEGEKLYYLLMVQFDAWCLPEAGARSARRILDTPPERSPFDAVAHRHLGDYHLGRDEYTEAVAQYDLYDASLVYRNADREQLRAFRRNEVLARFEASGRKPAVLVSLLDDPRHGRQMVATAMLGSAGAEEELPMIEEHARSAKGELRSALLDAASRIRTRDLRKRSGSEHLSIEGIAEKLAATGKLLWIMRDLRNPQQRWAALSGEFVCLINLEEGTITPFTDDAAVLVDGPVTARDIGFTRDSVWIGTNRGLFSYSRGTGAWRSHVVGGRFPEASVREVGTRGDRYVQVTIDQPGGGRRYYYDYARGRWTEARVFGLGVLGRKISGALGIR